MDALYDTETALDAYYSGRATRTITRLWTGEKLIKDLAYIGLLDMFSGEGPNPMLLTGASEGKLWLKASAGVTDVTGGLYRYSGSGSSTLEANWVEVSPGAYLQHLGGLSPVTSSDTYATRTAAAAATISGGITHLTTAGYTSAGDGGGALYVKDVASSTGGFQSADGAYWRLVPDPQGTVHAKQFGAKFDGTTDDTTALQLMITYLEALATSTSGRGAVGRLPRGTARVSNITIAKGIKLEGAGDSESWLYQTAAATGAMITIAVSHDGTNYYNTGNPAPAVDISGVRLIGYNRLSGDTSNHGIHCKNAVTNPITTEVRLTNVYIRELAGSGLYASVFTGYVEGYDLEIGVCTVSAAWAASTTDWRFHNCDFHGSGIGVVLSGASQCQFYGCNCWSNVTYGLSVYSATGLANHVFFGGMFDRNGESGASIGLTAGESVIFYGVTFIYNGQTSPNTYDEVTLTSATTGSARFVGCTFGRAYSQQTIALEVSRYHIGFGGTTALAYADTSTSFMAGTALFSSSRYVRANMGGTYTPTVTNGANVSASTAHVCSYKMNDSIVDVFGYVTVTATSGASTSTAVELSLPVGSELLAVEDLAGTAACATATVSGACFANAAANRAIIQWLSTSTAAINIVFRFGYRLM